MPLCLVVDDDDISLEIAIKITKEMGLLVEAAKNGAEALQHCAKSMPDLIILDMMMPRINGMDFLKELHRMIDGRKPHVIACTALNDERTVRELQKLDIHSYVVKPFEAELLKKKILLSGALI